MSYVTASPYTRRYMSEVVDYYDNLGDQMPWKQKVYNTLSDVGWGQNNLQAVFATLDLFEKALTNASSRTPVSVDVLPTVEKSKFVDTPSILELPKSIPAVRLLDPALGYFSVLHLENQDAAFARIGTYPDVATMLTLPFSYFKFDELGGLRIGRNNRGQTVWQYDEAGSAFQQLKTMLLAAEAVDDEFYHYFGLDSPQDLLSSVDVFDAFDKVDLLLESVDVQHTDIRRAFTDLNADYEPGYCYLHAFAPSKREQARIRLGVFPRFDSVFSLPISWYDLDEFDRLFVDVRSEVSCHLDRKDNGVSLSDVLAAHSDLCGAPLKLLFSTNTPRLNRVFLSSTVVGVRARTSHRIARMRDVDGFDIAPITPVGGQARLPLAQLTQELMRIDATGSKVHVASCRGPLRPVKKHVCGDELLTSSVGHVDLSDVAFIGRHVIYLPPHAEVKLDGMQFSVQKYGLWLYVDGCVPMVFKKIIGSLLVMRAWPDCSTSSLWNQLFVVTECCKRYLSARSSDDVVYFVSNGNGSAVTFDKNHRWSSWHAQDGNRAYVAVPHNNANSEWFEVRYLV